jgi:hypothetical protein
MSKRIDELIRHREALAAAWRSNVSDRQRLEIELDKTTTLLGELTGLGLPLLDDVAPPALGLLAGSLGGRRHRRKGRSL